MSKRTSRMYVPFKTLVLLLYGQHSTVAWQGGGWVEIKTGPWSRMVNVCSDRFKEYLEELQLMRYIGGLTFSRGRARFRIVPPPTDRLLGDPPP